MGRILVGDVRARLADLEAESVHACVTSPPYWGLRSYSTEPQVWESGNDCDGCPNFGDGRHRWADGADFCEACGVAWTDRHEWGDERLIERHDNLNAGFNERWGNAPGQRKQEEARPQTVSSGTFCTHCSAWRGELGSEPTPELFVAHIVEVFRHVKRVLRSDGSLWLNLGSSFAGGAGGRGDSGNEIARAEGRLTKTTAKHDGTRIYRPVGVGWKAKDLVLTPFMVAEALRQDGWWLRSAVPWVKRAAMPESSRDRPSTALEWMFLLTKAERYYYDVEAVRKPNSSPEQLAHNLKYAKPYAAYDERAGKTGQPGNVNNVGIHSRPGGVGRNRRNSDWWYESLDALITDQRAYLSHLERIRDQGGVLLSEDGEPLGFDVNPQALKEAHFASYPEKLVEPCILASTPEAGCCGACGSPYVRVVEREGETPRQKAQALGWAPKADGKGQPKQGLDYAGGHGSNIRETRTTGWVASCVCVCPMGHNYASDAYCIACQPIPATVLDPFLGSGTTAAVAERLGRNWIGVDLNEAYARLAEKRTAQRGFGSLLAGGGA